jgi:alanine racemase
VSGPHRALARIDLGAIRRNCAHLRSLLTGGAELCAVVKADGYGHGAVESARAAVAGGAGWLAVATADEAADLRREGIGEPILVMGALTRDELRTAVEAGADVVAWSDDFMRAASALGGARVHVKLDTGMGRLGTKDAELARSLLAHDAVEVVGVMTHFATADEPGDDYFGEQLEAFAAFAAETPDLIAHAANSVATYRDPAAHFDMVRCGIAVYGMDPLHEDPAARGLEPALSLESWVAAVKRFEAGESAGYGRRWRAAEPTWIATIPIGYGDGWRRGLSNVGEVLVAGSRRPLVGTISMDNVTVDLGPDAGVEPGAPAVLIGAQGDQRILAEEVARQLGTINYEITTGLSRRVRRQYLQ